MLLNGIVPIITLALILWAILRPGVFSHQGTSYFVLVLVLAGIIHGASDYFIYKALGNRVDGNSTNKRFNLIYLLTIMIYAVFWYLFTEVAMVIFLCVSIFHFGQSNWNHYNLPKEKYLTYLVYIMWGAYVTLTPLILHFNETISNLSDILIIDWRASNMVKNILIYSLCFVNILLCLLLWFTNRINAHGCIIEILNIFILFVLFSVTPLLFGFAIYFTLWHSTYSTKDQIIILRSTVKDFSVQDYFKSLMSMSLITFVFLGGVYYVFINVLRVDFGWGMLFLFISLLTLPHAYVINKFFEI